MTKNTWKDSHGTKPAELTCVVPVGKMEEKITPLLEKLMLTILNLDLLHLLIKDPLMNLWVSKMFKLLSVTNLKVINVKENSFNHRKKNKK